ncbi:MAG: hypothetical protein LBE35_05405 [Clostridiales bacterium]|jgi:hypothetical protein|nr:hypothetical protein [Clostridiales bacterium]
MKKLIKAGTLLGTGEGANYVGLENLLHISGNEVQLFRVMSVAEWESLSVNGHKFSNYDFAMEKKWFATSHNHARMWGELFYPDGIYRIIEITLADIALDYMFHVKLLDNIGPAYAADIEMLNKVVRRLRLV